MRAERSDPQKDLSFTFSRLCIYQGTEKLRWGGETQTIVWVWGVFGVGVDEGALKSIAAGPPSIVIAIVQKNPHAHKNKIGTSTPPFQKTQDPTPLKRGILWAGVFQQKEPENARRP